MIESVMIIHHREIAGYERKRYCVYADNGVVGVYTIDSKHGVPCAAQRDVHAPIELGSYNHCHNAYCEFVDGEATCDGSGLVPIFDNETDRWDCARMMAGLD